jgi:hypothetical protein
MRITREITLIWMLISSKWISSGILRIISGLITNSLSSILLDKSSSSTHWGWIHDFSWWGLNRIVILSIRCLWDISIILSIIHCLVSEWVSWISALINCIISFVEPWLFKAIRSEQNLIFNSATLILSRIIITSLWGTTWTISSLIVRFDHRWLSCSNII